MDSHDVIRKAFKNRGPKEVAAEMGLSLSLVYKWAQPNTDMGSGSRNPLDRVDQLRTLTGDSGIIEWLCQQAGGYFVRNPKSFCDEGFEVVPATNEIVQQFADLLSTISKAAPCKTPPASVAAVLIPSWPRVLARRVVMPEFDSSSAIALINADP